MTRVHDWPERLVAVLDRAAGETFELGRSDCFTLTMDVVEALTGADPWVAERGTYTTQAGALRRLVAAGFDGLEAFLASLGPEIHPAFAGRGDLGLATDVDGDPAAVVSDGHHWLGRAEGAGLRRLPRDAVTRAWRVG